MPNHFLITANRETLPNCFIIHQNEKDKAGVIQYLQAAARFSLDDVIVRWVTPEGNFEQSVTATEFLASQNSYYSVDQSLAGEHLMAETGLTESEVAGILRGGYGTPSTFTIREYAPDGSLQNAFSGVAWLEMYDKKQPPIVVPAALDNRKARQAQYLLSRVGGSGQFLDQLEGTLPDIVAHAATLVQDPPGYHSLYRQLGKLPTWSSAFLGVDGKPTVLIITKFG